MFKMHPVYSTTLIIAVFLAVIIHPRLSRAINHTCLSPCKNAEECNTYANCKHGEFEDNCGRKICYKGPDEPCGNYRRGTCGSGLTCSSCGFCQGCSSVTMECAEHECSHVPVQYKAHFASYNK